MAASDLATLADAKAWLSGCGLSPAVARISRKRHSAVG